MKENNKKLVYIIGFIPAFIFTFLTIVVVMYRALSIGYMFPIMAVLNFLIPYCLSKDKYKIIGFILTGVISLIYFIFASLPEQMTPNSTALWGIFHLVFYSLYYYFLKKS